MTKNFKMYERYQLTSEILKHKLTLLFFSEISKRRVSLVFHKFPLFLTESASFSKIIFSEKTRKFASFFYTFLENFLINLKKKGIPCVLKILLHFRGVSFFLTKFPCHLRNFLVFCRISLSFLMRF